MNIKFLGGAGEVGRSGFLLKGKSHILLDYGVKVDGASEYPLRENRVDLCLVSHAHLDHSGFVPALYERGSPITMGTFPTLKLAELLIEDSMKINKYRHEKPMFFNRQVRSFKDKYMPVDYGFTKDFNGYKITLHDAGHICGSALTLIENAKGRRLLYTGDFKLSEQTLQGGAEIVKTDILITESTYATSDHPDRNQLISSFIEEVREVVDANGIALLPVFAVGRAQELLSILYSNGLTGRTFVDGMAKTASEIVSSNQDFLKNPELLQKALSSSTLVDKPGQRRSALNGGTIILTTAGMLNGGPVLNYITRLNKNSKIFITGYQVEGTNGRKLLENKPLVIDKKKISIKTPVSFYDFSAHAGRDDLLRYAKASGAETVICVHGSRDNTVALANSLKEEGLEAYAPSVGDELRLNFG